jgi:hypothetical protein
MQFNSWAALNGGSTIAGGVQPASGDIIAASSFAIQLTASLTRIPPTLQPANFTVQYTGSPHTSFDLQELNVSCAVATVATTAFVAAACRIRFTAFGAGGEVRGAREVEFTPDARLPLGKSSMGRVAFGDAFRGIGAVRVELVPESLLLGMGMDSVKVEYYD